MALGWAFLFAGVWEFRRVGESVALLGRAKVGNTYDGKEKEYTVLLKMSELYSDGIIGREMQFMVSGLLSMKKKKNIYRNLAFYLPGRLGLANPRLGPWFCGG